MSKWHYFALSFAGWLLFVVMTWELPLSKFLLALLGASLFNFGNVRAAFITFVEVLEDERKLKG